MIFFTCARLVGVITIIFAFTLLAFTFYQSLEDSRNFRQQLLHTHERLAKLQNENRILKSRKMRSLSKNDIEVSSKSSNSGKKYKFFVENISNLKTEIWVLKKALQDAQSNMCKPSLASEKLRRRISNQLKEMWYFTSSQLESFINSADGQKEISLRDILSYFREINQITELDFEQFVLIHSPAQKRDNLALKISKEVQQRLHKLQHPHDCDNTKKLICPLNKSCGYGCQMHHVLYCFIVAYSTGRTMLINSQDWVYSQLGWDAYFLPVSSNCTRSIEPVDWGFDHEKQKVVELPIIDDLLPRPKGMPLSIPADLAGAISLFHGNPFVWWIGQFCKYIFRYQPHVKHKIRRKSRRLGFANPIVGVHIRRTDKINFEAESHTGDEYMRWVEHYFEKMSHKFTTDEKRVFVSTDDPTVVPALREKYSEYIFITNTNATDSADVHTRYSDDSLLGVISDIEMLSDTDFLVCTFSSQFCRLAYELMNSKHTDASQRFHSLDDIYYFGGQMEHKMKALWPHSAKDNTEIGFTAGDIIGIGGNHWDGYALGKHHISGRKGLFPAYKVEDVVDVSSNSEP